MNIKNKAMNEEEKLRDILRHIKKVEDNCNRLASKLDDKDFARQLIVRGRLHDVSKLTGYEFVNLNEEIRVAKPLVFELALKIHHERNSHHPEHYDIKQMRSKKTFFSDPSNKDVVWIEEKGIDMMSDLDIAEMVCDCFARSQEIGNSIKEFLFEIAPAKYGYEKDGRVWKLMESYLELLLTPAFKRSESGIDKRLLLIKK